MIISRPHIAEITIVQLLNGATLLSTNRALTEEEMYRKGLGGQEQYVHWDLPVK